MTGDVHNPATWHLMMLRAIAGLQAGDKSAATAYLQFVQQHRGRQVSEETKHRLLRLAQATGAAVVLNDEVAVGAPPLAAITAGTSMDFAFRMPSSRPCIAW